jgi:hypothetical protein
LRVVWRRWALVGGKSGQLVDPHIKSEVVWRLEGSTLVRDETLQAAEAVTLRRWWVAVPSAAARNETSFKNGQRWDHLVTGEGRLSVAAKTDWEIGVHLSATGDGALGKGARGSLPLHLIYESRNLALQASRARHWRITFKVEEKPER